MKRYVKSARTQSPKNWKMYGEYSDGYDTEVFGHNEEDCLEKLVELCDEHGDLTYYTGVNDDDYIDGEYFSEEERKEAGWYDY